MRGTPARTVATLSLAVVLLAITAQPAAAVHGLIDCGNPPELSPLLTLIHDLTTVLFAAGAAIGVAALAYAGIRYQIGGEDAIHKAKRRVKYAMIGVVILFASPLGVAFVARRLPGCGGG